MDCVPSNIYITDRFVPIFERAVWPRGSNLKRNECEVTSERPRRSNLSSALVNYIKPKAPRFHLNFEISCYMLHFCLLLPRRGNCVEDILSPISSYGPMHKLNTSPRPQTVKLRRRRGELTSLVPLSQKIIPRETVVAMCAGDPLVLSRLFSFSELWELLLDFPSVTQKLVGIRYSS